MTSQRLHRDEIIHRLMPPDPEYPGKKLCAGVEPGGGYVMFRLQGVSSDLSTAVECEVVRPCSEDEKQLLRELLESSTLLQVPCQVEDGVVALIAAS